MLGDAGWQSGNMLMNSLTLQPVREIYPTPTQLPPYVILSPYDIQNMPRANPWPLSLRAEIGAIQRERMLTIENS